MTFFITLNRQNTNLNDKLKLKQQIKKQSITFKVKVRYS